MAIRYSQAEDSEDTLIAQINTTPLVDVMLVLLIIFLITIPVATANILFSLPREAVQSPNPGDDVIVTVDAQGYLCSIPGALPPVLHDLLGRVSVLKPQPELPIPADAGRLGIVGRVVYAAQQTGKAASAL